jgi:excisionase family DNA binding protein
MFEKKTVGGGVVEKVSEPIFLRVVEAAKLLNISRAKAYALAASGDLPSVRIGTSVRIPRAAIEKLAEEVMAGAAGGHSNA